ncbi:MAG: hypothetical protein MUO76_12995 [Anaerolineaceae bacterium]|nr:hypothetical protein [Anaerolineaceae bacterium]
MGDRPVFAVSIISYEFNEDDALLSLRNVLGNIPVWCFSTSVPLTVNGEKPRTVVVALFSGGGFNVSTDPIPKEWSDAGWESWFARTIDGITQPQGLLLAGDYENANLSSICDALSEFQAPVAGCMSPSLTDKKGSFVQGENQSETRHGSTVILDGVFRMGVGIGHGWKDVG